MLPLVLLFLFSSGGDWINAYEIGDCGIRYNKTVPTIGNGESLMYNEFPWHIAIYKMDNRTSKYKYMCGGSIIDTNLVLTAAHCVIYESKWDRDNNSVVIAAGKHNSSWEHRDVHEQRLEVIRKIVPLTYRGGETRYADDIALLALNDSIKFSSAVMPVCLDRDGTFEPSEEIGTFVGWGADENNVVSEELNEYQMQSRNFTECSEKLGKGYYSFLTPDKFCAINNDNSTVRQGEGGGGLVFTKSQDENEASARYFIKGILSGRDTEGNNYALFTNITDHIPWINSTLTAIST